MLLLILLLSINTYSSMTNVFEGDKEANNNSSKVIRVFGGDKGSQDKESKPFVSNSKAKKSISSKGTFSYSSEFLWPVNGGKISSYYGWRSSRRFHDGLDIAATMGTSVYAAKGGRVIYSDNRIRGYGNMIVIKHDNGYSTVYGHNQNNIAKKGQTVRRGDIIARVGSTGYSTGPHLHFEIRKGKYSKDPLPYITKNKSKKTSTSESVATFLGF